MTQHDHVHLDADEADSVPVASNKPVAKVAAAGSAGALTVIVVFVAGKLGLEVPAEVAAAFTTLVTFAAGYLKSE